MVNALEQEIGWGHKIGIEDGDKLALRGLESGFERSRRRSSGVG